MPKATAKTKSKRSASPEEGAPASAASVDTAASAAAKVAEPAAGNTAESAAKSAAVDTAGAAASPADASADFSAASADSSAAADLPLTDKIAALDAAVEWFYGEDFNLDLALSHYRSAQQLASAIESDLAQLRNEVQLLADFTQG